MGLMHAWLLVLLFSFTSSYQFKSGAGNGLFAQDPELEWEKMETVIGEKMSRGPLPVSKLLRSASSGGSSNYKAMRVPEYVTVSKSQDQREVFKPEKGARPLPISVQEMLLGATATPSVKPPARKKVVEILCHVDRMYVRIRREVFTTRKAYKYLKLGSCPVNQGTKEHYYLLYRLETDCGFNVKSNVDDVFIDNVLHYKPPGPVLRELPFDIPLHCKYPRFFHSFKVGFHPKLQGGTIYKTLQSKISFTLTPQDASGNEITGDKSYTLGQPMYFEAKQPYSTARSGDQRIYVNKCFMTASRDPYSNPKYNVIDNQGCMIDGEVTDQSKFLTAASKMIQQFSVGSLIFKDADPTSGSSQQLYIHCEISVGELDPTPSSKACNYDTGTQMWKELYGNDSVCTCCESTCSTAQPKASRNMISSHSWKVDLSSKDGQAVDKPWMESFDDDSVSLEEPETGEYGDFLNYWEHDYDNVM